jgi:hypothetical protein
MDDMDLELTDHEAEMLRHLVERGGTKQLVQIDFRQLDRLTEAGYVTRRSLNMEREEYYITDLGRHALLERDFWVKLVEIMADPKWLLDHSAPAWLNIQNRALKKEAQGDKSYFNKLARALMAATPELSAKQAQAKIRQR